MMPRFGTRSPASASFSVGEQTAKPWARLAQPRIDRTAPFDAAPRRRSRYRSRVGLDLSTMRDVIAEMRALADMGVILPWLLFKLYVRGSARRLGDTEPSRY